MVQNLGNNTIMPVVEPKVENNPADKFIFKTDYFYQSPPPECAKSNPPCPFMPERINFKAGQSIGEDLVRERSIPVSVLALNPKNTASRPNDGTSGRTDEKDPWTGGTDWGKIFSIQNFWRLVIVMIFIFLFLKYMLPLIKSSLKKA